MTKYPQIIVLVTLKYIDSSKLIKTQLQVCDIPAQADTQVMVVFFQMF